MRHGEQELAFSDIAQVNGTSPQPSLSAVATTRRSDEAANLAEFLSTGAWREYCFSRVNKKFPAIVTYLSQLLAHDLTHSARADTRFELGSGNFNAGAGNLRTSGLLLHTIYGEGMLLDNQLYQRNSANSRQSSPRFQLTNLNNSELPRILPAFWKSVNNRKPAHQLYPVLGDTRNGDTPMLLWIAVEFMKFHNKLIGHHTGDNPQEHFRNTRIKVILTWHNIVENEILPKVTGKTNPRREIAESDDLNDTDFFHGLMRAFHSLPLNSYRLKKISNTRTSLSSLLGQRAAFPQITETNEWDDVFSTALKLWHKNWRIDLDLLTDDRTVNQTCFTPSFASEFGDVPILTRDIRSSNKLGVSEISSYSALKDYSARLLKDINSRNGGKPIPRPEDVPLSFGYLAESFFESKESGALGPIGASNFANRILSRIDELQNKLVESGISNPNQLKEQLPRSFADMMARNSE